MAEELALLIIFFCAGTLLVLVMGAACVAFVAIENETHPKEEPEELIRHIGATTRMQIDEVADECLRQVYEHIEAQTKILEVSHEYNNE